LGLKDLNMVKKYIFLKACEVLQYGPPATIIHVKNGSTSGNLQLIK
jgi:hypothetical protein